MRMYPSNQKEAKGPLTRCTLKSKVAQFCLDLRTVSLTLFTFCSSCFLVNQGRAKGSTKRRAPSRRLRTEGATISPSGSSPSGASPGPLLEEKSPAAGLPEFPSGPLDTGDISSPPLPSVSKPKSMDSSSRVQRLNPEDCCSELKFSYQCLK